MTREEFDKTFFCAGDRFKYDGEWRHVASVNFKERLIAYDESDEDDDDMFLVWLRCESMEEYVPYNKSENA